MSDTVYAGRISRPTHGRMYTRGQIQMADLEKVEYSGGKMGTEKWHSGGRAEGILYRWKMAEIRY